MYVTRPIVVFLCVCITMVSSAPTSLRAQEGEISAQNETASVEAEVSPAAVEDSEVAEEQVNADEAKGTTSTTEEVTVENLVDPTVMLHNWTG